ncbi:hypothetical protein FRX31_007534 [Thalictrum thalictroides]|uniref:Uncharacterized protein n=1 Tax=Thalictrum thalictroides TaxID=46969 RepID=A0A7J6WZJ0_THATH|nr:hypothetical protein FRX31_007534 [Thalictrum thalictroides]
MFFGKDVQIAVYELIPWSQVERESSKKPTISLCDASNKKSVSNQAIDDFLCFEILTRTSPERAVGPLSPYGID